MLSPSPNYYDSVVYDGEADGRWAFGAATLPSRLTKPVARRHITEIAQVSNARPLLRLLRLFDRYNRHHRHVKGIYSFQFKYTP